LSERVAGGGSVLGGLRNRSEDDADAFRAGSRLFVEGGTVLCKAHGRHLWSGLIWLDNPRINGERLDTARLSSSEFG
jgi:hypothetical protein